ncbi:YczE/YyaS/YitT family protein [Neobacillus sp. SCS-31]|uniref:YczE/YyaS/YitT family protein n=1 Tax=Neobacillus oceani TaxID=3115292 RepID=UPI0039057E28
MTQMNITKRLALYCFGLFFLSLGVSFSIQAGLGVSPVSSLPVAVSLTTGLSVGATTVLANVLFIIVQVILNKRIEIREYTVQLIVAFLFGFFMDVTLFIVQLLPTPETIVARVLYFIVSLFVLPAGLFGYIKAKLPLMPYDALTYVISERFSMKFGKAKITSDLLNVVVAGSVCLIFIKSFGSIGIGTLIAAYCNGKILGWMLANYQRIFRQWVYKSESEVEA